jgi:hypothetical protein
LLRAGPRVCSARDDAASRHRCRHCSLQADKLPAGTQAAATCQPVLHGQRERQRSGRPQPCAASSLHSVTAFCNKCNAMVLRGAAVNCSCIAAHSQPTRPKPVLCFAYFTEHQMQIMWPATESKDLADTQVPSRAADAEDPRNRQHQAPTPQPLVFCNTRKAKPFP